jgi:holo-[acyl-carrier protein] synthase
MITGIGTDLVEIARVQKAIGRSAFLEKVYTERERELIAARPARSAGNFAVKEAVAKALGCGFSGIAPGEIEVLRDEAGGPYVVLHGRAKQKAENQGITRVHVSITDTEQYAQAYVICEMVGACYGQ